MDLVPHRRKVYSQNGEDGIIEMLLSRIGIVHRFAVEISCGDCQECNTRLLREKGWRVVAVGDPPGEKVWITAENVNGFLDAKGVPEDPDLLVIDIDGNDYWIWKVIDRCPRLVVIEYNAFAGSDAAVVMPYDPDHVWSGSYYFGASLKALAELGQEKGYTLVGCENGINAFFVRTDLWVRCCYVKSNHVFSRDSRKLVPI